MKSRFCLFSLPASYRRVYPPRPCWGLDACPPPDSWCATRPLHRLPMRQQDGQTAESTGSLTVFNSVFRLREKGCLQNIEHWHRQDQSCERKQWELNQTFLFRDACSLCHRRFISPRHSANSVLSYRLLSTSQVLICKSDWLTKSTVHCLKFISIIYSWRGEGEKKKEQKCKTVSLAVFIWSVPMMLQGIVMGHSWLILNHGLKYFSERDLAVGIILNFYHSVFV